MPHHRDRGHDRTGDGGAAEADAGQHAHAGTQAAAVHHVKVSLSRQRGIDLGRIRDEARGPLVLARDRRRDGNLAADRAARQVVRQHELHQESGLLQQRPHHRRIGVGRPAGDGIAPGAADGIADARGGLLGSQLARLLGSIASLRGPHRLFGDVAVVLEQQLHASELGFGCRHHRPQGAGFRRRRQVTATHFGERLQVHHRAISLDSGFALARPQSIHGDAACLLAFR